MARKLVQKTESDAENNTTKARVIKICLSVIVLKQLLRTETDPRAALAYITELYAVDKRIPERAGLVLFELLFELKAEEEETKRAFAADVVDLLRAEYTGVGEPLAALVAQNCKGRVSVSTSRADIKKVFTNSSALGEFSFV